MPKKETMDSIKLPDKDKISELSGGYANSRRVYKERSISDFTNAVRADFSDAAPVKVPERTERTEEPDEMDKLIEERKKAASQSNKKKGVKVGKKYVAKWLVLRIAVICVVTLVVLVTFFPPFVFSTDEGKCTDIHVFKDKGLPQLKEEILSSSNVYNIDNLSSEKESSYRKCTVNLDIKNFTPYKIEIPSFKIVSCDPMYKDKFVCTKLADGKCEIGMFSVKTVTVEVLLNVVDLNEEQFDEAMTSLILRTDGMTKSLGPIPVPVIPAFVFVSDALEYNLNK